MSLQVGRGQKVFEPERKQPETKHEPMRIGLLGATFDTGNMGVSALAESSIKIILYRWPDCNITLLGMGREPGQYLVKVWGREVAIKTLPIRFCKNVFIENHFIVLCLYALLFKIFRWEKFNRFCTRRNASLHCINQMDLVADITGGDSFSDIYGMRRFVLGFLCKWLVLLFNKNLVMLPQTYGPFERCLARAMARHILKKASLIYSRDRAGVEYANKLLNKDTKNSKVRFAPDVAFVLDARRLEHPVVDLLYCLKSQSQTIIGFNVSGLLYNGGYTQDNMFGLKVDYPKLIAEILKYFTAMPDIYVLLSPHVFPADDMLVESDPIACRKVYHALPDKPREKVIIPEGNFNQGQIKYLIGQCDFFVGSRMHSCIAALSQGIPTVGIAYSKKFHGVFESVGVEELVVDMRRYGKDEILAAINDAFEKRAVIVKRLDRTIPDVQERIMNMFRDFKS